MMKIIDAHAHLWRRQQGMANGLPVYGVGGGRSMFMGEIRQMMPPDMIDDCNSAERFLSNMDFAQVAGAVITQELIDGNQDAYLRAVRAEYPDRFRVLSLYEEGKDPNTTGTDGVKLCAARMSDPDLTHHAAAFDAARRMGGILGVELADGDTQVASMREMVQEYPDVPIAIGHFGMVTRPNWQEQIKLARYPNVIIESGGITWLFNDEYYPYPSAVRAILEARDICGMDKLLWGSDYPRTMSAITYRMSWDFLQRSPGLTPEEMQAFLYDNAQAFFRFGDLPDMPVIHHMAE